MSRPRILIVEDDPVISMLNRNRLTKLGYEVVAAVSTGEEALSQAEKCAPDLALMDIKLGGPMDGIETAQQLRVLFDIPVIYVTAYTDETFLERAKRAEPLGYVVKPYGERDLRSAIEMALYKNRMERSLKDSEAKFRNLVDVAPFGICIMASDMTVEHVNRKFTEMFGYTIEDIPDKYSWLSKVHVDEYDSDYAGLGCRPGNLDLWDTLRAYPRTFVVICKDGSKKIISLRAETLENGREVFTCQDVTAEKRAQEEIVKAKTQWEMTFDAVSDGIMILDQDHRILRTNRAMSDLLGKTQEDVVGKRCYEVVHGEAAPPEFCPHTKLLADACEHQSEVVMSHLGGAFDVRVAPICAHDGQIVGSVHSVRDITMRKEADDKLRRAHEFQKQLLATAATAIFTVDAKRRITGVNKEFCQITGFNEEDVIGEPCRSFVGEQCATRCALSEDARDLVKAQSDIKTRNGKVLTVLKNTTVLNGENGEVIGGIESFVDITQLIHARIVAEQASRAKTDFVTNMSHELRTPLNAIIGFSELLLDRSAGELNRDQELYVGDVLDSGRHLLDVINGILDLAKVEAGKMELECSRVPVAHIIKQSMVMIREQAMKRGLTLKLSIENDVETLHIFADAVKLKQIIYNLLSNAAKFTPNGGEISVLARRIGNEFVMSISDTGIGIRSEDHERIFDMFEQADSCYTRKKQGAGIGLALTRNLVHLHGGQIWVDSQGEGLGCTFHFGIPILESAVEIGESETASVAEHGGKHGEALADVTSEPSSAFTILVVEDVELNLHFATAILEKTGYKVLKAMTAADGLRLAKTARPDLILMDVELPDVDGLSAVRMLKRSSETSRIPVVAVTACVMDGDEEQCRAAGCAAYIPKPVDTRLLRQVIRDLLLDADEKC
ncbi:MAG TPA: response regulator [Desulfomonilaceae bacterium]|nr:response regulator [Desulfomonilaceae bacterium]